MLIRRITEHVKAQNWFAVGLDLVIVVVGILLAFQITQWNEASADRDAEARYLASLTRDLRADIEDLEAVIENKTRNAAIVKTNLVNAMGVDAGELRAGPPLEPSALPAYGSLQWPAATASAFNTLTFDPSTQSFDMMVATGDVSLIRDYELVQQLMTYRQAVVVMEDFERNSGSLQLTMVPTFISAGFPLGHAVGIEKTLAANEDNTAVVAGLISLHNLTLASYARATQLQVLAKETLAALETAQQ